jgi:hypothetical protein
MRTHAALPALTLSLFVLFAPTTLSAQSGNTGVRLPSGMDPLPEADGSFLFDPLALAALDAEMASSGPQRVSVDLGDAVDRLKEGALGAIKNCDYQRYLRMATEAGDLWDGMRSLASTTGLNRIDAPFMDLFQLVVRGGASLSAAKSASAETANLLLTLEQVCHSVVQADEMSRQFDLFAAGSSNIGRALNALVAPASASAPDDRNLLLARYQDIYVKSIPMVGTAQDTLQMAVNLTLENALKDASDMDLALAAIDEQLRQARRDLYHWATRDTDDPARWVCPEGYPDPDLATVDDVSGAPLCGPCAPERCQQVTAHLELIKTQMRAMQLRSDARGLEVEAVRLMADNQERKQQAFTGVQVNIRPGW